MANLTFADTHNMVAFLSKSDASVGFYQIADFFNAQVIQYALMVNPTIYVSCIKQFWTTVLIKKVNDVVNEEICTELACMGYKKPPPKLTFYKVFFSAQWKFLIHTLVQCISAKRTSWNEFSCSMAYAVICLTTGRKFNFSKYIFDSMAQPQPNTSKSSMSILTTLMETCTTFSQKVTQLEQDKVAQALEIFKLKRRVKKLDKERRSKSSRGRIEAIDADEEITLVDMEIQVDLGAEVQGRKDDDKTSIKEASATEPTVFDDEEVTMTMAQKLIKMEAKKARFLDDQLAKREYNKLQTLFKPDKDVEEPQRKRVAEETLLQESFKKLKADEVLGSHSTQDIPTDDPKEMNKEDEIHSKGSRSYWKIIKVGGITEAYQSFKDMLKGFDRKDLDALWRLVKEKFNTTVPIVDKEKALWVELTRLFEPNANDVFWKLQRYMHYLLLWKLHSNCGVHQVSSTTKRHDMFLLTEKDCPLSNRVMTLMLSTKLQVEEDSEMARDLVMKIFMKANQPKSRSLDISSK
nr:hypothetical protein [Tanacetum cinerariifolium]